MMNYKFVMIVTNIRDTSELMVILKYLIAYDEFHDQCNQKKIMMNLIDYVICLTMFKCFLLMFGNP